MNVVNSPDGRRYHCSHVGSASTSDAARTIGVTIATNVAMIANAITRVAAVRVASQMTAAKRLKATIAGRSNSRKRQDSGTQAALYVAETTSGKFGVYTMTPCGDGQGGVLIKRHDLVLFRQAKN